MTLHRGSAANLIAAADVRLERLTEARMEVAVAGRKAAQRLGIEHRVRHEKPAGETAQGDRPRPYRVHGGPFTAENGG